jgi:hypothetical protein
MRNQQLTNPCFICIQLCSSILICAHPWFSPLLVVYEIITDEGHTRRLKEPNAGAHAEVDERVVAENVSAL